MVIKLSRTIPQVSAQGTTDIPLDAFDPIGRIVVDDYDASLGVHRHSGTVAFQGDNLVPVPPSYHLELEAEEDLVDELLSVIDPMIDALIAEHTTSTTKIPVAS